MTKFECSVVKLHLPFSSKCRSPYYVPKNQIVLYFCFLASNFVSLSRLINNHPSFKPSVFISYLSFSKHVQVWKTPPPYQPFLNCISLASFLIEVCNICYIIEWLDQWCYNNIIIISFMEGAAATYFKSLHDSSSRAKTGKLERHGTLCRRQGRRRDVSFCH